MLNRRCWHRIDNFYQEIPYLMMPTGECMTHAVTFRNEGSGDVVDVRVLCSSKGNKEIIINPCVFNIEKVYNDCKDEFKQDKFKLDDIALPLNPTTLPKILNIFRKWEIDTPEVELELKRLSEYKNGMTGNHIIPLGYYVSYFGNPARSSSHELGMLVTSILNGKVNKEYIAKEFKRLLAQGEDPNQRCVYIFKNDKGKEQIQEEETILFNLNDIDLVELLLCYGANPFERYNGSYFYSPMELAKKNNDIEKLKLFSLAVTKPQKSLGNIKSMTNHFDDKRCFTEIILKDNSSLQTFIKKVIDLTISEIQIIRKMFKLEFLTDEKFFDEDVLSNKSNIVELVYNKKNSVIGFSVYEMIKPKNHKNYIVIHWMYSVLDNEYRGINIMPLLAFRIALALQLSTSEFTIGMFFGAINYSSYSIAKDFLHYPKYQPKYLHNLVDDVILNIYNSLDVRFRSEISCYTKERMTSKMPDLGIQPELLKNFLYKYILGYNNQEVKEISTNNRAASIFLTVNKDIYHKINLQFINQKNEFLNYILKIALPFSKLILDMPAKKWKPSKLPSREMFWSSIHPKEGKQNLSLPLRSRL